LRDIKGISGQIFAGRLEEFWLLRLGVLYINLPDFWG